MYAVELTTVGNTTVVGIAVGKPLWEIPIWGNCCLMVTLGRSLHCLNAFQFAVQILVVVCPRSLVFATG